MKKIKKLGFFLLGISLVTIFVVAMLALMITEKDPLVVQAFSISPGALLESKTELKRVLAELGSDNSQKKITLTHKQMEQLASILSSSIMPLTARYNFSGLNVVAAISIKLPEKYSGRYINISSEFSDNKNLQHGYTSLGRLRISNSLFLRVLSTVISVVFDTELAQLMNDAVKNTTFDTNKIYSEIDLKLSNELFRSRLKNYFQSYRKVVGNEDSYTGSLEYYNYLVEIGSYLRGINKISIVNILQPLFKHAQKKSIISNPRSENRDALIALALFAGDANMKSFLSRVIGHYPEPVSKLPGFMIADREDLVQHFIYSIVIQLMSSEGISVSIGELKEISDMSQGGSGFSFADLAADRAGTRFANFATAKRSQALGLQKYMASIDAERDFFPDISILPENLTQQEFEREYKNTQSVEFKIVVREIDRRINHLPLYN
jgi:hypothetical protein